MLPISLGSEKVVLHVAEELDLHDVDFLYRDARNLGPGLVRISIVIKNCIK